MINIIDKFDCSGCSSCFNSCPVNCIKMIRDEEGFLYPEVDTESCLKCGVCVSKCPILTPHIKEEKREVNTYSAINLNERVRKESASGGVFSELASLVLNNDGFVYGAAFDDNYNVYHRRISEIEEIAALRSSKYVQSDMGSVYRDVEKTLKSGADVLFTGTPCQISGLISFLGNCNYSNLYTQDFICHGVPSPMVWQKYLDYRKTKASCKEITRISFKNKITGWKTYSISIEFKNNNNYREYSYKDPMMRAFLKNYCLRPSCHNCVFKTKDHISDITLADFWGVDKLYPEIDDNKGISAVIINSDNGRKIFDDIKDNLKFAPVNLDDVIRFNSSMVKSAVAPADRNLFMDEIKEKNFIKVSTKYLNDPLNIRIKIIIKRIFRRLLGRKEVK